MLRHTKGIALACVLLASAATAQDPAAAHPPTPVTITLTNGNTLDGTLKGMAGGVMTVEVGDLGDLDVPFAAIQDLKSDGTVEVSGKGMEGKAMRITGLKDGQLQFDDGSTIAVGDLESFNAPPKPDYVFEGNINLGLVFTEGNSNTRAAYLDATASVENDVGRLSGIFNWDYAEQENNMGMTQITSRRVYGELQYDYFLGDCDFLYTNASALGNTLAGLDLRWQGGVGYGRQLFDGDEFEWRAEVGLSYVEEQFRGNATPDNEYVAARVASRLRWQITDKLTYQQEITYLPSVEESDDVTGQLINRLNYDLGGGLVAGLSTVTDYDNTPAAGQDRIDNRYALTVGWVF